MNLYLKHFGLREAPFKITPAADFFYGGGRRGEILHALKYAIESGEGIMMVTGEVGSGKTMLLRTLTENLPKNIELAYIANPNFSGQEILEHICEELEIKLTSETGVMRQLQNYLIQQHSEGRRVVVLIDEAQAMPDTSLEAVRLLSNLETGRNKLLQIVMFGQPELTDKLSQQEMRQLRERITVSLKLEPFGHDDIREYISTRLHAAGYSGGELFQKDTYRTLAEVSQGLSRRINVLADKSLLSAFERSSDKVEHYDVQRAVKDVNFSRMRYRSPAEVRERERRMRLNAAIAAGVMLVAVLGAVGYAYSPTGEGSSSPGTEYSVEAVETESVETESVETEVAETEAVETEAAETEAAETEVAESETAETESIETESVEFASLTDEAVAEDVVQSSLEIGTFSVDDTEASLTEIIEVPSEEIIELPEEVEVTLSETVDALSETSWLDVAIPVDFSQEPVVHTVIQTAVMTVVSPELVEQVAALLAEKQKREEKLKAEKKPKPKPKPEPKPKPKPKPKPEPVSKQKVEPNPQSALKLADKPELSPEDSLASLVSEMDKDKARLDSESLGEEIYSAAVVHDGRGNYQDGITTPETGAVTSPTLLDNKKWSWMPGTSYLRARLNATQTWMENPKQGWTARLLTVEQERGILIERFLRHFAEYYPLRNMLVYPVKVGGQDRFVVSFGIYDTESAAKVYIRNLPHYFIGGRPYVEPIADSVQQASAYWQ